MRRYCTTLAISGRTQEIKEDLKRLGFRWHSTRRNWVKFGDVEQFDELYALALNLWQSRPGQLLFDCFTNEHISEEAMALPF